MGDSIATEARPQTAAELVEVTITVRIAVGRFTVSASPVGEAAQVMKTPVRTHAVSHDLDDAPALFS